MGNSIYEESFLFSSGWRFHATLRDDAGIVLTKVRHADHSFATDMRIVKVYVFPGAPDNFGVYHSSSYVLGGKACPSVDNLITTEVQPNVSLLRPYAPEQQIAATFEGAPAVKGGQKITFKQTYVFTDYNKSPSHEPGGIIEAARLYPLLRFEYQGTPGEPNPPERIRVDYRFDISLDGGTRDAAGGSPNLVGVFTDDDGFNVRASSIFRRAYKPLPVEMIGNGLSAGRSGPESWDNIHHWAKGSVLPPTPGAANAAHSHWRWGAIAASPPWNSHYKGLGGAGGPMLDPSIPGQTLRFALTGRNPQPAVPAWDASSTAASTLDFADLFTNGRSEPADIQNGSTLTQWWSFEATRSPDVARQQPRWSGTFFVHGFFFAHGPESFFARKGPGFTDALEKPPLTRASRKSWFKP
jgi:hypothetical protein